MRPGRTRSFAGSSGHPPRMRLELEPGRSARRRLGHGRGPAHRRRGRRRRGPLRTPEVLRYRQADEDQRPVLLHGGSRLGPGEGCPLLHGHQRRAGRRRRGRRRVADRRGVSGGLGPGRRRPGRLRARRQVRRTPRRKRRPRRMRPCRASRSAGRCISSRPPPRSTCSWRPLATPTGSASIPQGNLIGAGFASREVWRLSASHTPLTLAPCAQGGGTCYMGTEINTPDDITARSDGTIYFTDPTFASGSQGFPVLTLPLASAQGVYRLTTDGVLHLEDTSTPGPERRELLAGREDALRLVHAGRHRREVRRRRRRLALAQDDVRHGRHRRRQHVRRRRRERLRRNGSAASPSTTRPGSAWASSRSIARS